MRIAHVGVEIVPSENGAFVGGLVKNVATLSAEQVRRGHDVQVFTTDLNNRLRSSGPTAYGTLRCIPITGRYGSVPFAISFLRGAAKEVSREARRHPFDIVHVHSAYASLALLGRRLADLPSGKVFSLYSPNLSLVPGHDCNGRRILRGRRVSLRALQSFDVVVVPSMNLETQLRSQGLNGLRILRVPPLLDPAMLDGLPSREDARRRLDLPPNQPVLLFLGNYSRWKGVRVLLQALKHLRESYPDLLLLTAWGEPYEWSGNDRKEILTLIDQLHLRTALRQVGIVGDVRIALRAADVLVSPFLCTCKVLDDPLSILEGMACGTPVVGTRVGGIPEMLGTNHRGLCVAPGDPAALSAAIETFLERPSDAQRMASEASSWARTNFSVGAVADQMDGVYAQVAVASMEGARGRRAG